MAVDGLLLWFECVCVSLKFICWSLSRVMKVLSGQAFGKRLDC